MRAGSASSAERVVLCVAAKRPHKNQEVLVRALPRLLEPDVVLVLAGHPEPYDAELRAPAGRSASPTACASPDYVPDAELEALWRMAACAAFPTLAEGFGLPAAGGDAPRRGRGLLRHPRAARGRR